MSTGTWEEYEDPNTGVPYYYNATTNESTWTRPASMGKAKPKLPPRPPAQVEGQTSATHTNTYATSRPTAQVSPSPQKAAFEVVASPSKSASSGSACNKGRLRIGLLVGVLVVLAVVVAVVVTSLGGGSDDPEPVTTPLASSSEGTLMFAVSNTQFLPDGSPRVVARSYDGYNWEAVPDSNFEPIEIDCSSGTCSITAVDTFRIVVEKVPKGISGASNEVKAARLLSQGGFGASYAEITQVARDYKGNAGAWVLDQMRTAPTSSRQYMRARANARLHPEALNPQPQTSPCELNSRWNSYMLDTRDVGQYLNLSLDTSVGRFAVHINGTLRGHLTEFNGEAYPGTNIPVFKETNSTGYYICLVQEGVHSQVRLLHPDGTRSCNTGSDRFNILNPPIEFATVPVSLGKSLQQFSEADAKFVYVSGGRTGAKILTYLTNNCTIVPDAVGNAFIRYGTSIYLRFDKRLRFWDNTIESPSVGGPGPDANGVCPLVRETLLNRDRCQRRPSCGGALPSFGTAPVKLNTTIIRSWYTDAESRVVYSMAGLRLEAPFDISFCKTRFSRWKKVGAAPCSAGATALDATTLNTVRTALQTTVDPNPFVRDIVLTGANCNASNPATIGAYVEAGGICWQHVHPDEYSVRDATRWVEIHDGNVAAMAGGKPNPILRWAKEYATTTLVFPWHHPMSRWASRRNELPYVGRYGDSISFQALSTNLQTLEMALRVGALRSAPPLGAVVACGSPNETSNVPMLGEQYFTSQIRNPSTSASLEHPMPRGNIQRFVINNVMVKAQDQLRQRVAWALSNFLVISSVDLNLRNSPEAHLVFWDIFVRHAFGNYLDIIRDVSWTPAMARYLTYDGSRSYASSGTFPDENYARELMQLFTVGLYKINDAGYPYRDANRNPIPTYTNEDIVDFARVWTGFLKGATRKNFHDEPFSTSYVDPLDYRPQYRDRLPKAKLDSGHLGDTYPLCDELPPRPWLRPGARFEFTGSTSVEGDDLDKANASLPIGRRGRFKPSHSGASALYNKLCAPKTPGGACTYPLVVTLDSILPCHGPLECNAHRVLSVSIFDPTTNSTQYYRYVEQPCVRLTFFPAGRRLYRSYGSSNKQCGNPETQRGIPACCLPGDDDKVRTKFGPECLFSNEAMTYDQAEARCQAQNLTTCRDPKGTLSWEESCAEASYAWTTVACQVQIQVYFNKRIGIVDPINSDKMLNVNSFNWFRPRWNNENAPLPRNGACPADCALQPTVEGDSCLCDFTVNTTVPFKFVDEMFDETVSSLADKLHIGSVAPSHYGAGVYTQCGTCSKLQAKGIKVWLHSGDPANQLSKRTIVQLPPFRRGGRPRFLFNRLSTVHIGKQYSFRNPPGFIPLLGWVRHSYRDWDREHVWKDKVEHETEALLEHLFEHQSTAPFVATRMIHNMVTSNPSPRYMRSVVKAFRTGVAGNVTFSGKYGDMGALVYAILTDREARSSILLADKAAGMVIDPLVKLIHLTRSLEYKAYTGKEIVFDGLSGKAGVQVFSSPTVFNFYSPFHQPDGVMASYGLYAPQGELLTPPNMISFLNGLYSFIDNGLTACYSGFGSWTHNRSRSCGNAMKYADGNLTFVPTNATSAESAVNQLSTLLTGGRVLPNGATEQLLVSEYNRILSTTNNDTDKARKHVSKLLLTLPEFHTWSLNRVTSKLLPAKAPTQSQGRTGKTIILVDLKGGTDSFNMLVPFGGCAGGKDLFSEYKSVRGDAAIPSNKLLNISTSGQPCTVFGMHSAMPRLHQLYKDNDLTWFANIGALVEPMTLAQYRDKTGKRPPSLFAHNIMQRSMQNVHAQVGTSKGVIGRAADALAAQNPAYSTMLASMGGTSKALNSEDVPYDILSSSGSVSTLQQKSTVQPALQAMSQNRSTSLFSNLYASNLHAAIGSSDKLKQTLDSTTLNGASFRSYSRLSAQLETCAKLIKGRASEIERFAMHTSKGGWDTHNTFELDPLFDDVDYSIGKLADELKAQGRWDNTVIVVSSEFARTLRSNGAGTDHGWGGNAFMVGGAVKGGRILGKYPTSITEDGPYTMDGRGRILPSTPWEAMWRGILEWYGVQPAQMAKVLPNLSNFPNTYSKQDLFN